MYSILPDISLHIPIYPYISLYAPKNLPPQKGPMTFEISHELSHALWFLIIRPRQLNNNIHFSLSCLLFPKAWLGIGFYRVFCSTPIMEDPMEKKTEHKTKTGFMQPFKGTGVSIN